MRLNDIAAMPTPARPSDMRSAKPAQGDERGFGDLLEGEVSGGKDIGLEIDPIEVADVASAVDDFDMPPVERTEGLDGEHRNGDLDTVAHATSIRMLDRLSIDWLSLRMPGRDTPENTQEAEAAEQTMPVDGTEIAPSPVASSVSPDEEGVSADRQIAAVPGKRGERTIDEKPQPTTVGTEARAIDGTRTQTVRGLAVVAQDATTEQALEPQAEPAKPVDDKRVTTRMQAAMDRLDERTDAGAARSSLTQVASVSLQTIPAPSIDLQTPARMVLAALSEHAPEMARPVANTAMQQQASGPMRILRIQLHPLELGVVTAKLSLQGGAMTVELQTETRDAASRLATDSNDIVKALRGLGIEVDRVTVTQSSSPASPQPDQQPSNSGRGERFAGEAADRESAREQDHRMAGGGTSRGAESDTKSAPDNRGVFI
jgi:chemotaxis protein MotD